MSHLVSPTGFRSGKSYLWSNNAIVIANNKQTILDQRINASVGIEYALDSLMHRSNYHVVRTVTKLEPSSGILKLKCLYYPLVAPLLRKKLLPRYCLPRWTLNKVGYYNNNFRALIDRLWVLKKTEFNSRFVKTRSRKNLNHWLQLAMFRGSGQGRHAQRIIKFNRRAFKRNKKHKFTKGPRGKRRCEVRLALNIRSKYSAKRQLAQLLDRRFHAQVRRLTQPYLLEYTKNSTKINKWRESKSVLKSATISRAISSRVGLKIKVKAMNIFTYLIKKFNVLKQSSYQDHLWNKKYHYHKKRFPAYFDVVNSFYLLCFIPFAEKLVIRMIQYGLLKMHRRKIRPKNFFYFIDAVLKNMPQIRRAFKAIRVIITGKLRGGTARTTTFSAGFGIFPRQTLSQNIRYEFGALKSKYGSFGIKLLTWRA
jgi:hypothetical protein